MRHSKCSDITYYSKGLEPRARAPTQQLCWCRRRFYEDQSASVSSLKKARAHAQSCVVFVSFCPYIDRKSTRLNSSHLGISYAVFCLKKKKKRESTCNACLRNMTHEYYS